MIYATIFSVLTTINTTNEHMFLLNGHKLIFLNTERASILVLLFLNIIHK